VLDQPVWGVFGYDSGSAGRLVTNIALWARSANPAAGDVPSADGRETATAESGP